MTPKQIKWLKASQEWYFKYALPTGKELPFGQPPVEYKKCLKWYKRAKKWHDKTYGGVQTKEKPIPPPPPPPPGNPPA